MRRVFYTAVRTLLFGAVVCLGCYFAGTNLRVVYSIVIDTVPSEALLRIGLGMLLIAVGVLGIIPLRKDGPKNTISFPGPHGDVTMNLDSVEATLNRVVGKMPEVKKIAVRVRPTEDSRKATVRADVWIHRGNEPESVSDIRRRIFTYLQDAAVSILGVEEVTEIAMNVEGVHVDATASLKAFEHENPRAAAEDEPLEAEPEPDETEEEPEPEPAEAEEEAEVVPIAVEETPSPDGEPSLEAEAAPVAAEEDAHAEDLDKKPFSFWSFDAKKEQEDGEAQRS